MILFINRKQNKREKKKTYKQTQHFDSMSILGQKVHKKRYERLLWHSGKAERAVNSSNMKHLSGKYNTTKKWQNC